MSWCYHCDTTHGAQGCHHPSNSAGYGAYAHVECSDCKAKDKRIAELEAQIESRVTSKAKGWLQVNLELKVDNERLRGALERIAARDYDETAQAFALAALGSENEK